MTAKTRWFRFLGIKGGLWLLLFELLQKVLHSVPKAVIRSSQVIRVLESRGIRIVANGGTLHFSYPVADRKMLFDLDPRTSDLAVFKQIMIEEEYAPVLEVFNELQTAPKTVLDLGANIGLTSLYLKAHYPDAQVVALEPSASTLERLRKIAQLNHTALDTLGAGIWSSDGELSVSRKFRDGEDWSVTLVEQPGPNTVRVYSMLSLLSKLGWDRVDFLKIDVEGGEFEVFSAKSDLSWLSKIDVLAIEIHDEVGPRSSIETLLKQEGFTLAHAGELTMAYRSSGHG